MKKFYRTDLACEKPVKEKSKYRVYTSEINELTCTFSVSKERGKTENALIYTGKPYKYDSGYKAAVSSALSRCIGKMLSENTEGFDSILVCGLGNRSISSDSLGPLVADRLYTTVGLEGFQRKIRIIAPGVEGESGFSTFDTVKTFSSLSQCNLIIAIDSLCARSLERLTATLQLSVLGVQPGSGVGNHKKEISEATLGIPVLAIGVPTSCDLDTITRGLDAIGYHVSPSDIDLSVISFADIIADSIKYTFYQRINHIKTDTPSGFL